MSKKNASATKNPVKKTVAKKTAKKPAAKPKKSPVPTLPALTSKSIVQLLQLAEVAHPDTDVALIIRPYNDSGDLNIVTVDLDHKMEYQTGASIGCASIEEAVQELTVNYKTKLEKRREENLQVNQDITAILKETK